MPKQNFVTIALLVEGGLAIAALALGWLLHQSPLESIRVSIDQLPQLGSAVLVGLVATLPLLAGLLLYDRRAIAFMEDTKDVIDRIIVPLFRDASVFDLAAVSLAAGLGEEMLFRGLLQSGVAKMTGGSAGVYLGLVIASVVFGICHFVTPLYALLAGLVGAYLGWLLILTGNLAAPIVCHAVYDFVALVYFCKGKRSQSR